MNYEIKWRTRTMENDLEKHPLFRGIVKDDIEKLMNCLSVYKKNYQKNEYIVHAGNEINFVGILLSGRIFMEKEDFHGNNYFFTEIKQEYLFGEVFICTDIQNSTVNYRAITDCTIVFIKYDSILHMCRKNCRCHQLLIENLVNLLSTKSRSLMEKIEILSKNSLRERILTYLTQLSLNEHSNTVTSPLNHKELADFLCVNRSSMIRELNHMRELKLIDFNKNTYVLMELTDRFLF
jgi:CRP-like cAMP-binding protein